MGKEQKEFIKSINMAKPVEMEYYVSVDNAKEKYKFINRCERVIRSSLEYKDYIKFLKENCDMDRCAFLSKISSKEIRKISIEIHHEPFTLYDIVSVVVDKFINEGKPLNDLLIADEVMELHYANMVGLIPLTKTIHQAVHPKTPGTASKIFIPINMCYGNYMAFLQKYEEICSDEIIDPLYDKLEDKIEKTKNLTEDSFNAIIKEFKYLDIKGIEEPKKLEIESEESNIA